MTVEHVLEEIRVGQPQDEECLKKHMGAYRVRDVDAYMDKLQERMRVMESVYNDRCEEMRTNLLCVTRERDSLAQQNADLEKQLGDIPKYCQLYLKEQGMVAVPEEQYAQLQAVDLKEYEQLKEYKTKTQTLEQQNKDLAFELEKARQLHKEARDANLKLQRLAMQAQAQSEQLEQQKTQLQILTDQAAQKQEQIEQTDSLLKSQAVQMAQLQTQKQAFDMEIRHTQELNSLLTREKECLEKEASRQKELWEAERKFYLQRFNRILSGQKQYMQHLKDSITASIQQMEKMGETDFLELPSTAMEA